MAEGKITIDYNTAWLGYISYTTTQDVTTNTSSVHAELWMKKNDGYTTGGNGAWAASLIVGSVVVDCTTANGFALRQEYVCIGQTTTTIYHNSDGTGSCYISASVTGPDGTRLQGCTMSGGETISLDTIARASGIDAAKSVYIGDNCAITWTPLSESYYYRLKFSLGTWSDTVNVGRVGRPGTTLAYTYSSYQIPMGVCEQIPNASSGTMTVTLSSYSNWLYTSQVGTTSTATFTVMVPDSVVPTIDSCTVSIDNSENDVVESWGIALAGYSRLNVRANASGVYGSTITSYNIDGSYTASVAGTTLNYTGAIVTSSGNKVFKITCTDSRGKTSTVYTSNTIECKPYTQPRVKKLVMAKNTYDDDNTGNDRMVATGAWEFDSVGGKNSATAKIYYKVTTATDWTEHSGMLVNNEPFTLTSLKLNETSSYNFKVVVVDAIGNSAEKDAFSSTTRVLMDFQAGGRGLGIGKICEIDNDANDTSSLEVSMDSYFWGNMYLNGSSIFVISNEMYGDEDPEDRFSGITPAKGQIYFKKVGG